MQSVYYCYTLLIVAFTQFTGGIFTEVEGNESRRLYFDGSNPAKPIMRVAQEQADDKKVRTTYSWERGDSLHRNTRAII